MEFWVAGNLGIRQMDFAKAGDFREGHDHNFDHTSYVPRGAARFELLDGKDGKVIRMVVKRASDGYNWVTIEAGKWHRITAEEDNSLVQCIYAHRTPQGDVVQEYDGWSPAYE